MKKSLESLIRISILVAFILNMSVISTPATARFYILHSNSTLTLLPEKTDLGTIKPGENVSVNLTVTYQYTRFAQPKRFLFPSREPTRINITVESKPSWCEVELGKDVLTVPIPLTSFLKGGNVSLSVQATVHVFENAPGYERGTIQFKAEAGENGNIRSSSSSCSISLKTDFVPKIDVEMSRQWLYLKPGESGSVFVNITNRGNMPIVVKIKSSGNVSGKFSILLPNEIEVPVNETGSMHILIAAEDADGYVNNQTILPLEISYHAKGYSNLIGKTKSLSLTILVKSEKKPMPVDPLLIGIIAAIIIIVVAAIIAYVRRG